MAGAGGALGWSLPHGNPFSASLRSLTLQSVADWALCRGVRSARCSDAPAPRPFVIETPRLLIASLLSIACHSAPSATEFRPSGVTLLLHMHHLPIPDYLGDNGIIVSFALGPHGYALGLSRNSGPALQLRTTRSGTKAILVRRGEGPGEVRYADAIRITGSRTVAFDRAQSKLVVLDSLGQLVSESLIPYPVGWPALLDSSGALHWLRIGESRVMLASWTAG